MIIMYGTDLCPSCLDAKANLDERGVEYRYINITESLGSLKQFLKLRDTKDEFREIRGSGTIGVPTFVTADKITHDWKEIV